MAMLTDANEMLILWNTNFLSKNNLLAAKYFACLWKWNVSILVSSLKQCQCATEKSIKDSPVALNHIELQNSIINSIVSHKPNVLLAK